MKNVFADIPASSPVELFSDLLSADNVRIERILSYGQCSGQDEWYDQTQHEWVLVLEGEARIEIEGTDSLIHLKKGDYLNIPAHQRHRVDWTPPDQTTVWLAVFYGGTSKLLANEAP